MTLPAKGRELVKLVPEPVQLELRKISTGGAHVCREIFAGILVVGMIAIVGGYGRLAQGPISMPSLVPMIEERHQRRALRPPCEDRRRDPATLCRRSRRAVQAAQHPLDRYRRLDRGAGAARGHRHERRGAPVGTHRAGQRRLHRPAALVLCNRQRPVAELLPSVEQRGGEVRQRHRARRAPQPLRTGKPGVPAERRHRQTAGAANTDKRRAPARRDADGCRCLRAGTPRQHLLPHPLRRQGCAGRAQPGRCRDPVAGSGLLHRPSAQERAERPHRSSQSRHQQRRLAARIPHRATPQAAKLGHHGIDPAPRPLGAR